MQDASSNLETRSQRARFDDLHRPGGLRRPHLVVEEDVHVPRIPFEGSVFERLELVGDGFLRQDLAVVDLVEDARDVAGFVQFDAYKFVFQYSLCRAHTSWAWF